MEFKNCEEYVLAVLSNTEKELENVKEESEKTILELSNEITVLRRALEILNPKIEKTYDERYSIGTTFLWTDCHAEEEFKELVELLKLEYPKEES